MLHRVCRCTITKSFAIIPSFFPPQVPFFCATSHCFLPCSTSCLVTSSHSSLIMAASITPVRSPPTASQTPSTPVEGERTPSYRTQSTSTLLPFTSSFGDFILHFSSYRLSKETPTLRMQVKNIWRDSSRPVSTHTDLTMGPLLSKLRDRCVITDDASQFLTYLADGQPSCIIEDEDLHTAVWEALSMNQRVLHVQVNSAEEHGLSLIVARISCLTGVGQRSVVEAPAVPDPFRRGPDFSAPPSHRSRSHKNDKNS